MELLRRKGKAAAVTNRVTVPNMINASRTYERRPANPLHQRPAARMPYHHGRAPYLSHNRQGRSGHERNIAHRSRSIQETERERRVRIASVASPDESAVCAGADGKNGHEVEENRVGIGTLDEERHYGEGDKTTCCEDVESRIDYKLRYKVHRVDDRSVHDGKG